MNVVNLERVCVGRIFGLVFLLFLLLQLKGEKGEGTDG